MAFEKVHVLAKGQHRVGVNIHGWKLLSVVDRFGIRRILLGDPDAQMGSKPNRLSKKEHHRKA